MVEIGRRGFITGLVALVAAPAIIRVATVMPISTRFTPLYVPVNWLADYLAIDKKAVYRIALEAHGWPYPLGDTWVDIHDHDPAFVQAWAKRLDDEDERWANI